MSNDCCNGSSQVMILACSGASNVGQLSNQAAVELTQEGVGNMFCLAGIGGLLGGFVQSAKDTETIVVMDGCAIGCAKAIFNNAGIPLKNHLVLTDLGIEKNKNFKLDPKDVDKVKIAVKDLVKK
ncbi:MAG: putative zinc-binding protein [Desulfobacteraceae bacterium]